MQPIVMLIFKELQQLAALPEISFTQMMANMKEVSLPVFPISSTDTPHQSRRNTKIFAAWKALLSQVNAEIKKARTYHHNDNNQKALWQTAANSFMTDNHTALLTTETIQAQLWQQLDNCAGYSYPVDWVNNKKLRTSLYQQLSSLTALLRLTTYAQLVAQYIENCYTRALKCSEEKSLTQVPTLYDANQIILTRLFPNQQKTILKPLLATPLNETKHWGRLLIILADEKLTATSLYQDCTTQGRFDVIKRLHIDASYLSIGVLDNNVLSTTYHCDITPPASRLFHLFISATTTIVIAFFYRYIISIYGWYEYLLYICSILVGIFLYRYLTERQQRKRIKQRAEIYSNIEQTLIRNSGWQAQASEKKASKSLPQVALNTIVRTIAKDAGINEEAKQKYKLSGWYEKMAGMARGLDDYYIDPILGFLPSGIGDIITTIIVFPFIYVSLVKVRSLSLTLCVFYNILKDFLLGMLPFFVGDIIDFIYKSNKRNVDLIVGYINGDTATIKQVKASAIKATIGIVVVSALIVLLIRLLIELGQIFWTTILHLF